MIDLEATRYPLTWPAGWKRTPASARRRAAFYSTRTTTRFDGSTVRQKAALSVGDGLERLAGELRRLGAGRIVISSNLRIRGDGLPYAQQANRLDDPGVAVYFRLSGAPRVLACDKWQSAAENLAAIAGHIDAIRMQNRYGVGTLEQAFAGYAALPPSAADWAIVLGVGLAATRAEVLEAHRRLARIHHPDAGGRLEDMAKINEARDRALEAVGS
jgi:hypothetical protein